MYYDILPDVKSKYIFITRVYFTFFVTIYFRDASPMILVPRPVRRWGNHNPPRRTPNPITILTRTVQIRKLSDPGLLFYEYHLT